MLSLRSVALRTPLAARLPPPAAASARAFLPLHAPLALPAAAKHVTAASTHSTTARQLHSSAGRLTGDATATHASSTADSTTAASSPAADDSSSSSPTSTAASTSADGTKRKRSFKIFSRPSERRAQLRAQQEAAQSEAASEEHAAPFEELDESTLYEDDAGSSSYVPPSQEEMEKIAEAQMRGIAAKRYALQRLHPLKMFVTSQKHGLDKIRILPWSLSQQVDQLLKEEGFVAGRNEQLKHKHYALWHVANRSATEFAVLVRIMDEVVKRVPGLDTSSVLDYGAATNMSILALLESVHKYGNRDDNNQDALAHPVKLYRNIESNVGLARYGSRFIEQRMQEEDIQVKYKAHLQLLPSAAAAEANPALLQLEQSGVVVAPFSMGLLEDKNRRNKVLDTLWASVEAGGVLILAESGTVEGFNTVRECREYLLDKYGMRQAAQRLKPHAKETAATVVAPCGSNGVCPMGDPKLKQSCWHRTEILSSSLPLRTPGKHLRTKNGTTIETFSYLVLHKGPIRVTPQQAHQALLKWQPKEKDLYEPGQQGWFHRASREAEELRMKMEAEMEGEQQQEGEEGQEQSENVLAAELEEQSTESTSAPASSTSSSANGASASTDASSASTDAASTDSTSTDPSSSSSPPITKRTDLTVFNHLLPDTSDPQSMFEHEGYARILRKPLKKGEHVILDLCNENAQLERRIIAKSFGMPYTLARSLGEGDLWPLPKRTKDPTAPPNKGELRRLALKERQEKRKQKLSTMDEEEAASAKQALKEQHEAARLAKKVAKKQKLKERRDALIVARGGTVEIPVKRSERVPEANTINQMQQEDKEVEEQLKYDAETADFNQQQQQGFEQEGVETKETKASEAPKPKKEKKAAAVAEKPAASSASVPPASSSASADADVDADVDADADDVDFDPSLSSRSKLSDPAAPGATSQMPSWMQDILSQTRKAPGGLEYVGEEPEHEDEDGEGEEADEWDESEDREYVFPSDPTLQAAQKHRMVSGVKEMTAEEMVRMKHESMRKEKQHKKEIAEGLAESPLKFKRQAQLVREEEEDEAAPSAPSSVASSSSPSPRLPKWAAYRKPKSSTPVPATPANTQPSSSSRTPAQPVTPATAINTSSLPAHLQKLVGEVDNSPQAKQIAALIAQAKAQRDEIERKAAANFQARQKKKERKVKTDDKKK